MNINQVRYFEAALEEGSFSAAARAQFVTVQAVSKAIADLERELGQPLFIRENRCVRPTEFGLAFHVKALPIPAATFCANIPPLFKDMDDLAMVPIDQEHVEPVPICICTLKGKNVPQYKALVRMTSNPAVLMSIM